MKAQTSKNKIPYFTKGFIINAALASALVFVGGFIAVGSITLKVLESSLLGAAMVFLARLKEYSDNCENSNSNDKTSKLMNFVGI